MIILASWGLGIQVPNPTTVAVSQSLNSAHEFKERRSIQPGLPSRQRRSYLSCKYSADREFLLRQWAATNSLKSISLLSGTKSP